MAVENRPTLSFTDLSLAIDAFKRNDPNGFGYLDLFQKKLGKLAPEALTKVFHKHWKILGGAKTSSRHIEVEQGRLAFYNLNGLSSSNQLKAQTLEAALKSFLKNKLLLSAALYRKGDSHQANTEYGLLFDLSSKLPNFPRLPTLVFFAPNEEKAKALENRAQKLKSKAIPGDDRKLEFVKKMAYLDQAALAFRSSLADETEAFKCFELFCKQFSPEEFKSVETKIYTKVWKAVELFRNETNFEKNPENFGKLYFFNSGKHPTSPHIKAKALQDYLESIIASQLKKIATAFRDGNVGAAQKDFDILMRLTLEIQSLNLRNIREKIYEKMGYILGCPADKPLGQTAFHDQGIHSFPLQKAEAIEAYLRSRKCEKISTLENLKFKSSRYFATKGPFNPVNVANLSGNATPSMFELLKHSDGICFGESHDNQFPKEVIIRHMRDFKDTGVTELFMEQFYDFMQDDLDFYNKYGLLTPRLEANLITGDRHGFDPQYSYRALLAKAREIGLRVVAIDTAAANTVDIPLRHQLMHYAAAKIIPREMKGKFVALMGNAHLNAYIPGIPGVSELVQCPIFNLFVPSDAFSPPTSPSDC